MKGRPVQLAEGLMWGWRRGAEIKEDPEGFRAGNIRVRKRQGKMGQE